VNRIETVEQKLKTVLGKYRGEELLGYDKDTGMFTITIHNFEDGDRVLGAGPTVRECVNDYLRVGQIDKLLEETESGVR
jgi:hypothetical protein